MKAPFYEGIYGPQRCYVAICQLDRSRDIVDRLECVAYSIDAPERIPQGSCIWVEVTDGACPSFPTQPVYLRD